MRTKLFLLIFYTTLALSVFAQILSVCISEEGIVVCCKRGIYFNGIPRSVADRIIEMIDDGHIPRVVKFTDSGTYLITDGDKFFKYYM